MRQGDATRLAEEQGIRRSFACGLKKKEQSEHETGLVSSLLTTRLVGTHPDTSSSTTFDAAARGLPHERLRGPLEVDDTFICRTRTR